MVNIDIIPAINLISATIADFSVFSLSPGFDVKAVTTQAQALPQHSWEFGTAAEALLELYDSSLSVFGTAPFPVPTLNISNVVGLNYASQKVVFGTGYSALSKGDGSSGDPASLGVSAVMIGKVNPAFAQAANETVNGLLNDVPRFSNGAISHRANVPELWADWMYMVPPFLAYYAADQGDTSLLQTAVQQISLYRQVLQANGTNGKPGLWMHVIGPESQDTGHWSTGNAWAAAGMTRVLATVMKAPQVPNEAWRQQTISQLTSYIKEILDAVMGVSQDGGLLRNYLDDYTGDGLGFGEISGTSLMASVVYRMVVLQPTIFGLDYVNWADNLRSAVAGNDANGNPHITSTGIATPAVNPMWWKDTNWFTTGSPEGQAFVVMMYASWRDCMKLGLCATGPTVGGSDVVNAVITKRTAAPLGSHGHLRRHITRLIHNGSK